MGYNVQVVYVCDHHNFEAYRIHEMLDGLWAVGIRTYPVIGNFPDYVTTDRVEEALRVVGVQLVDHIIVADDDYVSMAASGILGR